ncbi:MAG: hypothetical protein IT385_25170 [Deltaproteobacteria bacterium]|nr:hypothetical protein [Deltaproteobacteria bacterium]
MRSVFLVASITSLVACGDEGAFRLGSQGTLVVEPAAIEIVIDETAPGMTSLHDVTIANVGTGPLVVRALRVERTDGLAEVVHATPLALPLTLEPGAAPTRVTLVYTRRDDVARELALAITSSDPTSPIVRVPIEVTRGAGHLVAHPAALVFERTAQPVTRAVRLMNTGNAPLAVSRLRLVAPAAFTAALGEARLDAPGSRDLTLAEPVVIGPSSDREVVVTFAPTDTLPVDGQLVVYADAPNAIEGVVVDLAGNQGGRCLIVRPPALVFGTKPAGATVTMPLHLESCGDEDVAVSSIRLADAVDAADPALVALGVTAPSSPRFALVADPSLPTAGAPLVVAAGESVSLLVSYATWTSEELGGVAQVRADAGAIVVASDAYVPVAVVPVDAATELEEVVVPPVPGCEWQGGAVETHKVAITLTADNFYELWVNGENVATDLGNWSSEDTIEVDLESGCHVIGIHAWGDGAVTAGMIAAVEIDGVVRWTTGDSKPEWSVTGPSAPAGDWHDLFYDDSAWSDPRACVGTSQWGTAVDPLLALGARWVWWNPECDEELSTAWFRLTFTVD